MTKIEKWHAAKNKVKVLEEFIECFKNDAYDKKGIRIEKIDTWMGRYGNSSTSSWSNTVKDAIIYEMEHSILTMAEQALDRAYKESKQACLDAAAEARAILREVDD